MGYAKRIGYSEKIARKICEAISTGSSVRQACEEQGMPHEKTVYAWLGSHEDFRRMYEAAQEVRAELLVNDILEEADNIDTTTTQAVAAAKVTIETKKWVAGKFKSARYGDKQTIDLNANVKVDRAEILNQARKRRELAKPKAD